MGSTRRTTDGRPRHARGRFLLAAASLALVAAGCGVPVGVTRVSPETAYRSLTRNVLGAREPSWSTANVLYQRALVDTFANDPERALAELHAVAVRDGDANQIFALAELSFLHARRTGKRPYYLAAAVYAWAFLFPEQVAATPSAFDPRFRTACDLYNWGITGGLRSDDGKFVALESGSHVLPFGTLDLTVDPAGMSWAGRPLVQFAPVADMEIHGLPTRFRWPGLGAPLAARPQKPEGEAENDLVPPNVVVPVTAILRVDGMAHALATGRLQGSLEVYPASGPQTVSLEGKPIPLENESTATLAYMLAESPIWRQEIAGFLKSVGSVPAVAQLRAIRPYQPGSIPVVFVHGTASSAGRWAEMVNELDNDPRLHDRYQFWFFSYDTGNPILYSAMLLQEALEQRVESLDPTHADPALRQMVVIGHSQGGMLTKLTAVDSGSKFWDAVSRKPFDEVHLSDESRELLGRAMFVDPLPFVRLLIFVATPQHGSYVAGNWLAHQVARLVTFPGRLLHVAADAFTDRNAFAVTSMPTAVQNMTPGTPFVRTLAALPLAPGVHAHSIIAVTGEGPPQGQNDGVVEYDSAHIDGVESELVVRSGHSCQDNPHTINEVRRILLLHLQENERIDKGVTGAARTVTRVP